MSERKLNDEQIAKEAIASSPEVTNIEPAKGGDKANNTAKEAVKKAKPVEKAAIDEEKAQKDSEIVRASVSSAFEQISGERLNSDQEYLVAAFGKELFCGLQSANMPRPFRIGLLGIVAGIAFLPAFFSLKNKMKEKNNDNKRNITSD